MYEWLTKITITCFAASYLVTLLLEISRLFFRAPVRLVFTFGFAAAGLLAHSLYKGERDKRGGERLCRESNVKDEKNPAMARWAASTLRPTTAP